MIYIVLLVIVFASALLAGIAALPVALMLGTIAIGIVLIVRRLGGRANVK